MTVLLVEEIDGKHSYYAGIKLDAFQVPVMFHIIGKSLLLKDSNSTPIVL